ncbi:unnamed protein product [Vitrella brassicaformis CCMP3155]|uniref:Uncharacterized protein n=1 Tax=Vitrella brassicaformis (strain CCMP3155) TaxID=1169540 RepID=A0A0G4GSH8_VITBC|nr:unnamed protein product [Vitrella brassicaformis CCMP3155]|eukprot:CEM33575.1 unnamed protein product [Vitrella brassicaformis CCMP3155]
MPTSRCRARVDGASTSHPPQPSRPPRSHPFSHPFPSSAAWLFPTMRRTRNAFKFKKANFDWSGVDTGNLPDVFSLGDLEDLGQRVRVGQYLKTGLNKQLGDLNLDEVELEQLLQDQISHIEDEIIDAQKRPLRVFAAFVT